MNDCASRTWCVSLAVVGLVTSLALDALAGEQSRVISVDGSGVWGNNVSLHAAPSANGRLVAFNSVATNLVPGDTNGHMDVFVRDRQVGTTLRVSVRSSGEEGNSDSFDAAISADGNVVAFVSYATNLVPGDTNGAGDVFVHERSRGKTSRVSVRSSGGQSNSYSLRPTLSADGRFVAFWSRASNLVTGDLNGAGDVFVHDRQTATTTRVSVDSSGAEGDDESSYPSISADGRFVAFNSYATNLVAGDTNFDRDVFVHDQQTGTTSRVSVRSNGSQGNGDSDLPSISPDGRWVAFYSLATNLVSRDTNGVEDVFLHDRQTATTSRVSVDSAGAEANGGSFDPSVSAHGRRVSFMSRATNLVTGDTNGSSDIFVHDRSSGATTRVSYPGAIDCQTWQEGLSDDGRFACFAGYENMGKTGTHKIQVFAHGPDLTLEAEPAVVPAGGDVTFSIWDGGEPFGQAVLVVIDVNGTPTVDPLVVAAFDAHGRWTATVAAPPGLAGSVVTLVGFGHLPTGVVDSTNRVTVTFQ